MDDGALSGEARLRAFLKALKYRRRADLDECIDIVLAEAPVLEEEDLFVILTYLETGPTALSNKMVQESLERLVPERKERIMGPLTQPYYEKGKLEGRSEGRLQGRSEGRAEGEAKILALLIEKRFGALPESLRQRIFAADVTMLEAWVERVFDATDAESVFESN